MNQSTSPELTNSTALPSPLFSYAASAQSRRGNTGSSGHWFPEEESRVRLLSGKGCELSPPSQPPRPQEVALPGTYFPRAGKSHRRAVKEAPKIHILCLLAKSPPTNIYYPSLYILSIKKIGRLHGTVVKNLPAMQETQV